MKLYNESDKGGLWICKDNLDRCDKEINQLENRLYWLKKKDQELTFYDMHYLKSIPMENIIKRYGIKIAFNGVTRIKITCQFHDENTPSMMIDKQKNTFHCFGCGKHGDNIDLVMKMENCDFRTACAYLQNFA